MKNLDSMREELREISQQITTAVENKDPDAVAEALQKYGQKFAQINSDASLEEIKASLDNNVITARGLRAITGEERAYAKQIMESVKNPNAKQAIADIPKALPTTIINTVLEDIKTERPLLAEIDLRMAGYNYKTVYSEGGTTPAVWGQINAAIVTEITKAMKVLDGSQMKLSAFLPVPKGFIDFSEEWLITLVISLLTESYGAGLEKGYVAGTGKDEPIGMIRNLDGAVTGGVYPEKTAVKLTELTPAAYGALIEQLCKRPDGTFRTVKEVMLISNPSDFLTKVGPATTVLIDGVYRNDIYPFPTKVFTSEYVTAGKAILGIPKKYIGIIANHKDGAIDYDDSCQFLEDNRVYTVRSYGNGVPKDNYSFIVVNISDLKPYVREVKVVQTTA